MIRKLASVLAVAALAGCSRTPDPIGVWMLEIGYFASEEDPTETITHNYLNATPEVDEIDESSWTYDETFEISPMVLFGEVFAYEGGEEWQYVMVVNESVLLGADQEDGSTLFTWTGFYDDTDSETHTAGYNYTEGGGAEFTWAIDVDLSEDTAASTLDLTFSQWRSFLETDTWNYMEVGMITGQTPAEDFLDSTQTDGYVHNSAEVTDCTGTPCTIDATWTMTGSAPVTATRTGVEPGDFGAVEYAGQPFGIPEDLFWGPSTR